MGINQDVALCTQTTDFRNDPIVRCGHIRRTDDCRRLFPQLLVSDVGTCSEDIDFVTDTIRPESWRILWRCQAIRWPMFL